MMRTVGVLAVSLVLVWVVAHVFYLGPVKDATEMALVYTVWVTVAACVVASLTVLAFGLMAGARARPGCASCSPRGRSPPSSAAA